ncbi:MAG: PASTA domain-containing protein [Oscillospiraceae bacterium]|nr:PASTA domain-containing protein [Oscillospiraceae bacterium]
MSGCIFCGRQLNNEDSCIWCDFPQKSDITVPGTLGYGTKLGQYVVGNVTAVDGESTTYAAFDTATQKRVVIKEFLPVTLVGAREGDSVTVQPAKQVLFKNLLFDFIDLYNTLKTINSPAMPQIYDVFVQNNTAYAVMQNVGGTTLGNSLIKRGKPYTFKEIRWMLGDIFALLQQLTKYNIHHGGISDETVVITADNTVMLTGFAIQDLRTKNEHIAYKLYDGFSAPEQYYSDRFQGFYTDIYALACLIYYAVTGKKLTKEALDTKDINRLFPKYAVEAIRYATKENPDSRIDSVTDFVLMLDDRGSIVKQEKPKEKDGKKNAVLYAVIGVVFAAVLIWAFSSIGSQGQPSSSQSESIPESVISSQPVVEKSVPNLVGQYYSQVISNSSYQQDYTFVRLEAYSGEYAAGQICEQSPRAGDTIVPGGTVYLTVSLGPRVTYVPTGLIGISYNDAAAKLDDMGITYRKEYVDQTREYVAGMVAALSIGEGQQISIKEDILVVYVANDKPFEDSFSSSQENADSTSDTSDTDNTSDTDSE